MDVVTGSGKFVLGFAAVALAVAAGWPIASCELANVELHDDLRDIAADKASKIGLTAPNSDDDLRSAVVRAAREYDIQLEPEEVTVRHTGTVELPGLYLAADYRVRVRPLGVPFVLHFSTSSDR
jgi:hypothetical protein